MPTYEYRCKTCQHTFEQFQSITAKPVRRCPECGKGVERLIGTGAGIIFRGSGFYCTDYRSDSYREKAKGDKAPAAGDAGGGSKSGGDGARETPPAPAPAAKGAEKKSRKDAKGKE
ncbi:MAG TPA: zinc ribbon domain-containing protein [Planctomycetota bacterium]|nr:zinc ribbon domain-containing protein [Planctomycetota bacterium]